MAPVRIRDIQLITFMRMEALPWSCKNSGDHLLPWYLAHHWQHSNKPLWAKWTRTRPTSTEEIQGNIIPRTCSCKWNRMTSEASFQKSHEEQQLGLSLSSVYGYKYSSNSPEWMPSSSTPPSLFLPCLSKQTKGLKTEASLIFYLLWYIIGFGKGLFGLAFEKPKST